VEWGVFTDVAHVMTLAADDRVRTRAQAGDDSAFAVLIGPLVEPALRLAYAMLGDPGEAEDATQEALTSAWRKLHQLREGMPVRPWLLAIVMNRCRNVRRTRWFRLIRVADPPEARRAPDSTIERMDIDLAIARLPQRDRQALFLHFYLDLPLDEVALALGISASAAKARIYRACHRLRPGLTEEDH
jgi:RNA polymerase sigma factor (sigma-70 family)